MSPAFQTFDVQLAVLNLSSVWGSFRSHISWIGCIRILLFFWECPFYTRRLPGRFFKPLIFLNVFTVKAAVFNSVGKGLMLVTSYDHRDGLPLNYVHVPFSRVVGNVSSPIADRLTSLVPTVRTVTPGKIGQKSATFTMCRVDSRRVGGVSSTFLKSDRSLAVNDCPVLQNVESL